MIATHRFIRLPIQAVRITALRTAWRTEARYDQAAMGTLVQCVRSQGWLQAITVRPLGEGEYELIDGERRLNAAREAGHREIDAVVLDADDAVAGAIALIANLGGKQLRPIEKALLCETVRDAMAMGRGGSVTQAEVGEWIGLKQPTVCQYLQIAQAFHESVLLSVDLTRDDLAPVGADLLSEVARLTRPDRIEWLQRLRADGPRKARRPVPKGSGEPVLREIERLAVACRRREPAAAPGATVVVLSELLPLLCVLVWQLALGSVAVFRERAVAAAGEVRNYRSPIAEVLREWVGRARKRVAAAWTRLRSFFHAICSRVCLAISARSAAWRRAWIRVRRRREGDLESRPVGEPGKRPPPRSARSRAPPS